MEAIISALKKVVFENRMSHGITHETVYYRLHLFSLLQTKFTITMRKISTDHNDHAVQSLDTLPKKCFKWKVAVEIHKQ